MKIKIENRKKSNNDEQLHRALVFFQDRRRPAALGMSNIYRVSGKKDTLRPFGNQRIFRIESRRNNNLV